MKINDIMTTTVETISPEKTIRDVANLMRSIDSGAILVAENDRLIGMITDRDIVIRAVADGLGEDTPVNQIMTADVCYCYDDEDVQQVAENMADLQVRRLPVVNRQKRLVGVVSLGNIASCQNQNTSATVLHGVANAH